MKPPPYIREIFSLFFLLFIVQVTYAQKYNIAGDTVYVNSETEVRIRFPSMPSSFYTAPLNAPYNFKTLGKGFTVSAKQDNTKPAALFVMEGSHEHRFILVFKKKINYSNTDEIDLDYSSKKKLKRHVKQQAKLHGNP
jgi:hypothetical protein